MTRHACDTLPSCLASSSTPTFARITFCSVVIVLVLHFFRTRGLYCDCKIKSWFLQLSGPRVGWSPHRSWYTIPTSAECTEAPTARGKRALPSRSLWLFSRDAGWLGSRLYSV